MPAPRKDWKKIKTMTARLRAKPRTLAELQAELKISDRTAYRYLREIEKLGHSVFKRVSPDGVTYYFLPPETAKEI